MGDKRFLDRGASDARFLRRLHSIAVPDHCAATSQYFVSRMISVRRGRLSSIGLHHGMIN